MINVRLVAMSLCCVAIGGALAGCSADGEERMDRSAAQTAVNDSLLATKIIVTNKQGPQSPDVVEYFSATDQDFNFLDDQGYILEWDEMTSQQKAQYHTTLLGWDFDLGGHEMMSESRRDVPGEIRDAAR